MSLWLTPSCFLPLFQVIAAEGEMNASRALKEAADIISESPSALQLRYLQTLTSISAEKNSTIIFPLPVDFLSRFLPNKWLDGQKGTNKERYTESPMTEVSVL